jgi:hypothetical protein
MDIRIFLSMSELKPFWQLNSYWIRSLMSILFSISLVFVLWTIMIKLSLDTGFQVARQKVTRGLEMDFSIWSCWGFFFCLFGWHAVNISYKNSTHGSSLGAELTLIPSMKNIRFFIIFSLQGGHCIPLDLQFCQSLLLFLFYTISFPLDDVHRWRRKLALINESLSLNFSLKS